MIMTCKHLENAGFHRMSDHVFDGESAKKEKSALARLTSRIEKNTENIPDAEGSAPL